LLHHHEAAPSQVKPPPQSRRRICHRRRCNGSRRKTHSGRRGGWRGGVLGRRGEGTSNHLARGGDMGVWVPICPLAKISISTSINPDFPFEAIHLYEQAVFECILMANCNFATLLIIFFFDIRRSDEIYEITNVDCWREHKDMFDGKLLTTRKGENRNSRF
jgi:hypothetical protein